MALVWSETGYPDILVDGSNLPEICEQCADVVDLRCTCVKCSACSDFAVMFCDGMALCLPCDQQQDLYLSSLEPSMRPVHEHTALPNSQPKISYYDGESPK